MTHQQQIEKIKPARPCTAHDSAIGGGCFNCLWDGPHGIAPLQPSPKGFYTDNKEWNLAPHPSYAENPPDDWEDCDQCGGTHPPHYAGDCRSDINRWPSEKCVAALTTPTLTKRLSWRTKNPQFFQSFGCGQIHIIHFAGNCESCGRSVYSHGCQGARPCGDVVEASPDPRGIIPAEHCLNLYHAREYDLKGRNLVTCATCADDGDRYRALMAQAKHRGTWTRPEVIGYLCGVCGKSGPECKGENHKFVCGEEVTQ